MIQSLFTTQEIAQRLSNRFKQLRLSRKWKRTTLAEKSGVSVSSIIRFEQQSHISLHNLLKLLNALGRLDETELLLLPPKAASINDLEKQEVRMTKRGSI